MPRPQTARKPPCNTVSKSRCTFKVVGKDTHGRFGLFECAMDPGAEGAKPHIHHTLTEIFYVAAGEVHLRAGAQRIVGRPGTLVLVPSETVYGSPTQDQSYLFFSLCSVARILVNTILRVWRS